jgi:hypothetical protein
MRTAIVQMSHALRWNTQSHTATTMATQATTPMILPNFKIPMPPSLHVGSSRFAHW